MKIKLIINPLILLVFFQLIHLPVQSQDKDNHHKNFLGIYLSELPFVDFRLSYERRITPSHGLKIDLGYKPAYRDFTDATNIDLGLSPTAWCYRNTAQWYYASIGYRYYVGHRKVIYFSPELFYKYMNADMVGFTYGVSRPSNTIRNAYQIRSMTASISGLNLLLGKKLRIQVSEDFNLGMDVFAGISLRYKKLSETIYGSTIAVYYHDESPPVVVPFYEIPDKQDHSSFQLAPQFGIKIYASW
jgi:hypothetical protein